MSIFLYVLPIMQFPEEVINNLHWNFTRSLGIRSSRVNDSKTRSRKPGFILIGSGGGGLNGFLHQAMKFLGNNHYIDLQKCGVLVKIMYFFII